MPFDPDDTRLTAFALGELDDADRAAVEAEIADCAESRKYIEEVRETARLLTEQFHAEPAPGLTPEQRRAIEVVLEPAAAVLPLRRRFRWAPVLGFAAAAGIFGVVVTVSLSRWTVAQRCRTMPRTREKPGQKISSRPSEQVPGPDCPVIR